eukprot:m.55173 g.55173  ORF g.55173 m.55173 type:complete len:341 (-) comp10972_c0_seq1:38-1060(-)
MSTIYSFLHHIGYWIYTRTPIGRWEFESKLPAPEPHRKVSTTNLAGGVTVEPIPYARDNYCYLITNTIINEAVVVDPGDFVTVSSVVKERDVKLVGILATHRHFDHTAGVSAMLRTFPKAKLYGSAKDNIPQRSYDVASPDLKQFDVAGLTFEVIETPGHTVGHVVFKLLSCVDETEVMFDNINPQECLFSGDALFVAGCGRLFEGTPKMMSESLEKLSSLKESTLLFPGHEYGLTNLLFTYKLDRDNAELKSRLKLAYDAQKNGEAFVPSTIRDEKLTNPFLRTHLQPFCNYTNGGNPADAHRKHKVFGELRSLKDSFSITNEETYEILSRLQGHQGDT